MTLCDLDLPLYQPLAWVLFLQKNIYFAELHTETHYFAEISVCKKFYYRKVYFFKQQSVTRSWCSMPKSSAGPLVARVDM